MASGWRKQLWDSEDIRSKATGWAWQFAIFAVGTLPAAAIIVFVDRNPRQ
jgi:hypothetical protein